MPSLTIVILIYYLQLQDLTTTTTLAVSAYNYLESNDPDLHTTHAWTLLVVVG